MPTDLEAEIVGAYGEADVLKRVRACWASLWTTRATFVRHEQEIGHDRGLIAPGVQVMVDADKAGVLFTANPVTSARDEIVVEANWGTGESVVSGAAVRLRRCRRRPLPARHPSRCSSCRT